MVDGNVIDVSSAVLHSAALSFLGLGWRRMVPSRWGCCWRMRYGLQLSRKLVAGAVSRPTLFFHAGDASISLRAIQRLWL